MRQGDSLKSDIGYFQNPLAKVLHCDKDVSALTFIHQRAASFSPLYKYLLKHDITRLSEVQSRAQAYIQLEKVMKRSINHSNKCNDEGEKSKL